LTFAKPESAEVRSPMLANTGSSAAESSTSREDRKYFPFGFFLIRGASSSSEDNFRLLPSPLSHSESCFDFDAFEPFKDALAFRTIFWFCSAMHRCLKMQPKVSLN